MKVTVNDGGLADALKTLLPSAGKPNGLATTGTVLLETAGGEVWVRATNGTVYASVRVSGVVSDSEFRVAFEPGGPLKWLELNGWPATLTEAGGMVVLSGAGGSLRVRSVDPSAWPVNDATRAADGVTLDGAMWRWLLRSAAEVVDPSADVVTTDSGHLYRVCGVQVDVTGAEVRAMASNRVEAIIAATAPCGDPSRAGCLIPLAGVRAVLPLLTAGPVRVGWTTRGDGGGIRTPVWFEGEGWEVAIPQAAGSPPPYETVLAGATGGRRAVFAADDLTAALKSVMLVADDKYDGVVVALGETAALTVRNGKTGCESRAECGVKWAGDPVEVKLSARVLERFVRSAKGEQVQVRVTDPARPVVVTVPDGRVLVIMPRGEAEEGE